MPQCNAKAKSTGKQCTRPAVNGSTKCRYHGGATPRGIASPHYKGKGRSKYMPANLLQHYEEASSNPEVMSLYADIHLIDALLLSNFKYLDTDESGKAWKAIRDSIVDMNAAFANDNYGKCVVILSEMKDIVDKRVLHFATEAEIRDKLEQRRKLVETIHKIDFQKERAITAEQAMLLMTAILDSVRRNVSDTTALTAIQNEFIRLVGATHQHQLDDASD